MTTGRHFIALIHKDDDSGYGVSFPDLPGTIATADTLDAALLEAAAALAFALEDANAAAVVPRSLDVLRSDALFLEDSRDAVVAAVRPAEGERQAAE